MSESADKDNRTEAATPRRMQQAREEGQVALSRECIALAVLGAAALVLGVLTVPLATPFTRALTGMLHQATDPDSAEAAGARLWHAGLTTLWAAAPLVLGALLAGAGAVLAQTGLLFATALARPRVSRLNPWAGLKRMVGLDGAAETVRSLAKIAAMAASVWFAMRGQTPILFAALAWPMPVLLEKMLRLTVQLLLAVLAAQALIALGDLVWVHLRHARTLRMSREELKEETKEQEGDPRIKARIRQIRQLRARRRMMAAIPTATVVITNPTHYAIALAYDRGKHAAPRVVAKGVDAMAARIRESATQHRIPIVANPPLARALYLVELDHDIPLEHFKAVAEIIAHVWRLDRRMAAQVGTAQAGAAA